MERSDKILAEYDRATDRLDELDALAKADADGMESAAAEAATDEDICAAIRKYPLYAIDKKLAEAVAWRWGQLMEEMEVGDAKTKRIHEFAHASSEALKAEIAFTREHSQLTRRTNGLVSQHKSLADAAAAASDRAEQALKARQSRPTVRRGNEFLGWDAEGNPIVAIPDGSGGNVARDGRGGYTPLIPTDGGYLHRNEEGNFDFKPAR